jgi:NADPH-dependent 2,4-dienoyl-CoA reductase/sulfur reductase-like enzyme
MSDRLVIVGAGPAGVRAAQTLVEHGLRPVLIDESGRGGGQIYRQPPGNFKRSAQTLYGFEANKARAIHRTLEGLRTQFDYRPDTLVWNGENGVLDTLRQGSHAGRQPYDRLIIASGATDRVLPIPGWTLPGVYTLGAAQIALKFQGCAIGSRVVLAGSGPLLYLVAYQYAKAGATVAAVLDTSPLAAQVKALPRLLMQPATFAKGLYYRGWLTAKGIPVHQGVTLLGVEGTQRVSHVRWATRGTAHELACDALGFSHALRSETQLADLLGCHFQWSPLNRAWLPVRDALGRTSTHGVYLAGDGAGILGADGAEMTGELAALAVLEDLGHPVSDRRRRHLLAAIARLQRFRAGLETAFPFPEQWAAQAPDALTVCRCEEVTAGDVRAAVQAGHWEVNRVKATCRAGMGRCQGRVCGAALVELIACESGRLPEQVGRLRAQAPIKPLPFDLEVGT